MRMMLVSDLHFGGEDPVAIAAATRYCEETQPDLVLVAGDVSSTGRRREMAAAARWLRSLGRPVVATPGNHDAPYWNPIARIAAPYRRFTRHLAFETQAQERIVVQPLNTARAVQWRRLDWSLGVADADDVAEAVGAFAAAPTEALRIVLAHHPLKAPEKIDPRARTRGGEAAAAALAKGGADVLLSGHLHEPFVREVIPGARVWAIGSGTLSHRVRGAPPSFVSLSAPAPQTIRVEHITCATKTPEVGSSTDLPLREGRLP